MKKVITVIFCLVMAVGTSLAQNSKTITGYVVDKNGNPIAGAEVMAAGGGATTLTDSDGSFNLEVHPLLKKVTVSYPGMDGKTLSVENKTEHIITLKETPKRRGFINIVFSGGSDFHGDGIMGTGLMGGTLGNWGWYVKGLVNYYVWPGNAGISLTAGAIKRIHKSFNLYFGAGGIVGRVSGGALDLGAISKVGKHIDILAGLISSPESIIREYGSMESTIIWNLEII